MFSAAAYARELALGDYVTMGSYYGKPIVWRCVDINENGALMISDRIIANKAFDAAGVHENDVFGYRAEGGGGKWSSSSLRKWLNSAEETVSYGVNVPSSENVTDNAYDTEKGFLTNFSQSERELINSVEITSVINGCDASGASQGTQEHIFKAPGADAVQNYSSSYVHITNDKIFLPGVCDIKNIKSNIGVLGALYERAYPTYEAVSEAQTFFGRLGEDFRWFYWLRDSLAYSTNNDLVRCMFDSGNINFEHSNNGSIGVRPMFYLDTSLAILSNGDGSEQRPYKALNEPWVEITENGFYVEAERPFPLNIYKQRVENADIEVYIDGELSECSENAVVCSEGVHEIYIKAKNASGDTLAESSAVKVISVKYNTSADMLNTGFEGSNLFEGFASSGKGNGRFETVESVYGTSLRLVGVGSTAPYLILPSLRNVTGTFMIESDFLFENYDINIFSLKTQPESQWINIVKFTDDGTILFYPKDKNSVVLEENAQINKWYNIKMLYDIDNAEVSIFINNKAFVYKEPIACGGYEYFDYININSGDGARTIVVDNIRQRSVEETAVYEITAKPLMNTLLYTECNNGIADFRAGSALSSSYETVNDDEKHGKALKLTSTGTSGDAAYVISPSLQNTGETLMIEAEYKFPSAGRHSAGILNVKTQPEGKFLSLVNLTAGGDIVLNNVKGGNKTLISNIDSQKWYSIRCIYDKKQNTVKIVIDGDLLAEDTLLYSGYEYFDYVNINGGATVDGSEVMLLIDNVRIAEIEKTDDICGPMYAANKITINDYTKSLTGMKIVSSAKKDGGLLAAAVYTITGSGEIISVLDGVKENCIIETYLWDGLENIQPFAMKNP